MFDSWFLEQLFSQLCKPQANRIIVNNAYEKICRGHHPFTVLSKHIRRYWEKPQNICQESQWPDREWNPKLSKYTDGVITTPSVYFESDNHFACIPCFKFKVSYSPLTSIQCKEGGSMWGSKKVCAVHRGQHWRVKRKTKTIIIHNICLSLILPLPCSLPHGHSTELSSFKIQTFLVSLYQDF